MGEAGFCTNCGAPRRPGTAFCARCGTPFSPAAAGQAPPAPSPPAPGAFTAPQPPAAAPSTPPLADLTSPPPAPLALAELFPSLSSGTPPAAPRALHRLRRQWLPVLLVALVAYLDYITHSNSGPAVQIILGGIAVVLILFGKQIVDRTGLREIADQIPKQIRPILIALPPAIWFAARDQGTSGAGIAVVIVSIGLVAVTSFFGPQIDTALAGFYTARNRTLPAWSRLLISLVLPVLVSAIIVHGSLASLPVLFQGHTSSAKSAAGRAGLIAFAALFSGVVALLLLREKEA